MSATTLQKIALNGAKLVIIMTLAAIAVMASGLLANNPNGLFANAKGDQAQTQSEAAKALAVATINGDDEALDTAQSASGLAANAVGGAQTGNGAKTTGLPAFMQTSGYQIKRILDIDEPLQHGDYAWDDAGVPDGEMLITVDLTAQTISVFRGGYEIGAAVILFGGNGKPTPLGTFPITQKNADHVSNIYNVPMPYMMRLTNDGIAVHGSEVEWGYATHGCIGVPTPFAKLIFDQVKLGDKVIITDGKMMQLGDSVSGI